MSKKVIYLVEGDCEKTLINALKESPSMLKPGKIYIHNPVSTILTKGLIMTFAPTSDIVLVFDTDVDETKILKENISRLIKYNASYKIITIPQVKNFEDEIFRATNVSTPTELTNSKSLSDFKRDFINVGNCRQLLSKHRFNINDLWIKTPTNLFSDIKQMSNMIKI